MPTPIALLILPGSPLGGALAERIETRGGSARVLSLNAPWEGGAITVHPDRVTWEGCVLSEAGAILVERPEIAWPQPLFIAALPADRDEQARAIAAEREARSLGLSAITAAAEFRPVINNPAGAHLAAAPAMALDLVQRAGIEVHPWRMSSAEVAADTARVDAAGRDRWHDPIPPADGEPAIAFDPVAGEVDTCLVVGDRVAATRRNDGAAAWASRAPGAEASPAGETAKTAIQAAKVLGLELASISLIMNGSTAKVLFVDAAPDLAAWAALSDSVLDTLAERLIALASTPQGGSS